MLSASIPLRPSFVRSSHARIARPRRFARACDERIRERDARETSPPALSASGSGRWRAAGGLAHRAGADLSVASGASDCGVQCSTLVTVPATTSSSQRPPRAVAACGDETAGGLGKMLMASQDVDQMVDIGAAMSGVQLDSKPR